MNEFTAWATFGISLLLFVLIISVVGLKEANETQRQAIAKGCSIIRSEAICPGLTK